MIAPRIRRLVLAGFAATSLLSTIVSAFAQPAPVPALPDSERRTSYSITASTCSCAVNFQIFGDGIDFSNWVEVFLNGIRVNFNDPTFGWTITSPSGPLSNLARPITDGVLTFTNPQTGTVQIVGARRPRRVSQYNEGIGVPTRNFNRDLTDIIAQNRELWDKTNDMTGRGLFFAPGNTTGPMPLPAACQGALLGFDSTGLKPVCTTNVGSGNITLPVVSGNLACFNGTTGLLQDCGIASILGPNTVLGSIAGGKPIALSQVQQAAMSNAVDNHFGSGTPWIDVKSGANGCAAAVGNNSTDDTAAIQCQLNFINAHLGGGVLYFPHGNYLVSSPGLLVKGSTFLHGAGRGVTSISASTDTNVVTFDASTCHFGTGMADIFVSGFQNVSATKDAVVVGTNCSATLSRNDVFGGHHALNNAGQDGTYTDNFFCGWTGDNVFSTGANWYFSNKLDACGSPGSMNGFEQGVSVTGGIAEKSYIPHGP
jgi:Pectate lyase superfamily protein